jgi:hypothetical protein
VLPVGESFSERLREGLEQPAISVVDDRKPPEVPIAWLDAEWDGTTLRIGCRLSVGLALASQVEVALAPTKTVEVIQAKWSRTPTAWANLPWSAAKGTPVLVHVQTETGDLRSIAVRDVRQDDDSRILCSDFEEAALHEALDDLIEEKYGGSFVNVPGRGGGSKRNRREAVTDRPEYAVPAYIDARRRFRIIDTWWSHLEAADDIIRPSILKDGMRIAERWLAAAEAAPDRGIRLASRIAADELQTRLRRYT